MKANCLFIGATKYNFKDKGPSAVKYPLLTLMSNVIDIADVEVIDFEKLFPYPCTEVQIEEFKSFAKATLAKKTPDIVAVSCYTSFDYLATVDILNICRQLFPQAILAVGGYHPTAVPEDFTGNDIEVDFVIRGEGEEALRKIILNKGQSLPQIMTGDAMDLSREKALRYDLYPYKTQELYISLSRGCFHRCAFCVQSDDFPNQYRKMDLDCIEDKIDRAVQSFPIKRLLFSDPIFGMDMQKAEHLINFLEKKYPHLTYWAETRIDRITEELIAGLSRLKMDLHFGVESLAADTLLNLMDKTKNAEHYNECFFKTIELCQKYHVLGMFGFIMNYPGEQAESSQFTLRQLRKAVERYQKVNFTFHINQYALYPGNKIYDRRHQLEAERGFYFPNDGWWRSNKPDIRERSEACIASGSIKDIYGGNIHYWHKEKNDILKSYVSKYDSKAYQFYQRDEVKSIIEAFDERLINSEDYDQICDYVVKYRFVLKSYLYLYDKAMREESKEFITAFQKIFIYATHEGDIALLETWRDGQNEDSIATKLCELETILEKEFAENMQNLSLIKKEYRIAIIGKTYRIDNNGKIKMTIF